MNIRKASDIAAIDCTSAASSTDGLYIWDALSDLIVQKPIICEYLTYATR